MKRIMSLSLILLTLTGCATLLKRKTTDVDFISKPAGAKVYVDGDYIGTTPTELQLDNKKSYVVVFKLGDGREKTYHLTSSVRPVWVVLDIIGGVVPIAIDAITGEWNMLSGDKVKVAFD